MNIVNEAIRHLSSQGGATNLEGWYYDLVLDRLERMGFVRHEGITNGSFEGSTYRHPEGGEFKVVTNRFHGPMTVIKFTPSPGKPARQGT